MNTGLDILLLKARNPHLGLQDLKGRRLLLSTPEQSRANRQNNSHLCRFKTANVSVTKGLNLSTSYKMSNYRDLSVFRNANNRGNAIAQHVEHQRVYALLKKAENPKCVLRIQIKKNQFATISIAI